MRISVSCRASVRQPLMCQHPIAQGMIWIEKNTVLKSGPRFRQRWHHQTVGAYPTVTIGTKFQMILDIDSNYFV